MPSLAAACVLASLDGLHRVVIMGPCSDSPGYMTTVCNF